MAGVDASGGAARDAEEEPQEPEDGERGGSQHQADAERRGLRGGREREESDGEDANSEGGVENQPSASYVEAGHARSVASHIS